LVDIQQILESIEAEIQSEFGKGKVADYIPALARVPPRKFGIAVCGLDGREWTLGDANEQFSIQSISKVFTLLFALKYVGANLWDRVGKEPSGTAFNSLVLLEAENGIPRNPFINAGAIVVTDCVASHSVSPVYSLLNLVRTMAGNQDIFIDEEVASSEAEHGNRNAAIAHFLKAHGNLVSDVETVINIYFRQCAIAMSCVDLARAFLPFANKGVDPRSGKAFFPPIRARRINSLLLTCGLYDGVGEFAFRVGIPAKSGVGGGIVGVVPGHLSICVWSPELDDLGNSRVGTAVLELFAAKTGLSVF
jgi:glutaminase